MITENEYSSSCTMVSGLAESIDKVSGKAHCESSIPVDDADSGNGRPYGLVD